MPRRRFIIAFFFLITTSSAAQQLHVENYTPANGLLDARVIKIFQDARGLMYFLTWEGISIFDGQRFKNISDHQGTGIGLVNDMIQWKKDTCIVFSFQNGVYKMASGRLTRDTTFNKITEPNKALRADDNNLVIASNNGLFHWDGNHCRILGTTRGELINHAIEHAAAGKNMLVYYQPATSELGAISTQTLQPLFNIPIKNVTGIVSDNHSGFFIKTGTQWMQLNTALPLQAAPLQPLYFAKYMPPGFTIHELFCTSDNRIWLLDHKKGYLLLDPATGNTERYSLSGAFSPGATSIFCDQENNYWFTIFSEKIQKAYYTRLKKEAIPGELNVSQLGSDEHQLITVCAGNRFIVQKENNREEFRLDNNSNASFYWQGMLWKFKTPWLIESDHPGAIINLKSTPAADTSFFHSYKYSFDREGRLIITGNALYVISKDLIVHAIALPYFTDNIITDNEGRYWALARNGSVSCYTLNPDGKLSGKYAGKLLTGSPRYAAFWNKDTICVGTRLNGIKWVVLKKDGLQEAGALNTSNGLSNNFVSCLAISGKKIYATTGFGFDEITISRGDTIIQNLSAANNLFVPFNYTTIEKTGKVYARSDDGQLWSVSGYQNTTAGYTPSAWFSEIAVNGKPADNTETSFPYFKNNFQFTVSAPCFTNAAGLRYRFNLTNENKNWYQLSADNRFSINNLSPGNYTLTATVKYPGRIYADQTITTSFTILSPIWKRRWFIAACILLSGLLIAAIVRNYYRRKLTAQKTEADKRQAVERERNRISRDMHDDLGSGLTKIAILSEVAKKQLPDPAKAREQLEKISLSSRELVDNLQDIIWVLNPKNDTLESLAAYIREFTLKYFESLSVKADFEYPEEFSAKKISEEKRRNVYLTVKETIHNIAKHAWCNNVRITISETAESFTITIQDDGKGFDADTIRPFANGLKNMQARIGQSGGQYSIVSEPGRGSVTTIHMPA